MKYLNGMNEFVIYWKFEYTYKINQKICCKNEMLPNFCFWC